MSTNIRVFVQWTEQTVFAGEDVECQITFKNIATKPAPPRTSTSLHPQSANGFATGEKQRKVSPQTTKNGNPRANPPTPGHRSAISLSAPPGVSGGRSPPAPSSGSWNGEHTKPTRDGSTHRRSVSIISIGGSESAVDAVGGHQGSKRTPRGHARSASLQIVPRRHANGGPTSAPLGQRSSTQPVPSPLFAARSPPINSPGVSLPERITRRQSGIATAPSTPGINGRPFARRQGSGALPHNFKFPLTGSPTSENRTIDSLMSENGNQHDSKGIRSPHLKDSIPSISEQVAPVTRILSPSSISGTPRSSGEFYSLSNNSTETLASEYMPQLPGRTPSSYSGHHVRRPSNLLPVNHHRPPETLMMGYAQISGSFTVDGSLINQASFDEVKRKGAVGGQGGGVIGVESNKRDSGLLGGFGWGKGPSAWGNIGESIGGLLGGGELSSIKDMRGIANSRSVPLLSTPQSILFVDLRLAPGESKSFKYAFKLPRGLPPSHRGKAIKISYKLVVGTQRPGGAKEQQVKSVDIPFRVLGSVNSHGELLGHDLMSPYIILRDQARIKVMEDLNNAKSSPGDLRIDTARKPNDSTLADFLAYVDELVTRPRQNSSLGLLSPTEAPRSRRQSYIEEPASAKEAIDMAIMWSNTATEFKQSANRFEIARSGRRVAVVMLARPAYRLGETVTVAVDFTDSDIPCYAIHAALETSEKVDNSIALRSEASLLRVTRKVYASHSEATINARQIVFSPTIPVSATPEFITSGVSLDWRIKIEFVTPHLAGLELEDRDGFGDLLEEISRDDRGVVLASAENLDCESFEVAVPLRVYGALAGNTEKDNSSLEGLVV